MYIFTMTKENDEMINDVLATVGAHMLAKHLPKMWAEELKKKSYKIQHTSETYRTINHWSEIGLIDDERQEDSRGWRAFSAIDLIWIRVIQELRVFGLALEKIASVKQALFSTDNEEIISSLFFNASGRKCLLLAFRDGESKLVYNEELAQIEGSFLCLDVIRLAKEVLEKVPEDLMEFFEGLSHLTHEEQELIAMLRTGQYEEVNVILKDGNIKRFEMKQSVKGRMIDLLKEHDFQDITVKSESGKIISLKRTIKHIPISKAMENIQAPISTQPSRPSEVPKPRKKKLHANN